MLTKIAVFLFMALALVLVGCGGDEPTPTPLPMGVLEVRVTDLPSPTITAIDITVEDIEVHRASDGEWVKVVEGPMSFDLIAVAGIGELLGGGELAPGKYTQIRLRITSATITDNGVKLDADVPGRCSEGGATLYYQRWGDHHCDLRF